MHPSKERLLNMLRALADESRLTLLELMYEREHSVGELAQRVDLAESTVSHHLSRLHNAGLITLRMAGSQRFYRLNEPGLAIFKQTAAEIEQPAPVAGPDESGEQWIAGLGWDPADQQVLRDYTRGGQLTSVPTKQKKLMVILRWLATLFEPDRMYAEAEVNEVLKTVYERDFASLRRDLVDFGYLRRERGGGKYWLTPANENVAAG